MICLAVRYIINEGFEEEARWYMAALTESTMGEPGNLLYVWHGSPSNPRQFFLYEQYRDQAALDFHRNASYVQQYVIDGLAKIAESRSIEIYEPLDFSVEV